MSRRRQPMHYDRNTPCDNCPFRREGGIRLRQSRVTEIVAEMESGKTFECHKTAHAGRRQVKHQHCVGALILSERLRFQTPIFQIATRLGILDASTLRDKDKIFESVEEMLVHQED
jgi:hypothetical protein